MSKQAKVIPKVVRIHPETGQQCFVAPHSLVADPDVADLVEEIEKIAFAWFEISPKVVQIVVNAIDMCVSATGAAKALHEGKSEDDPEYLRMDALHENAFKNLNRLVHSCPKEFGFMLARLSQLTTYHIMDDDDQYPHPDSEESTQQ